MLQPDLILKGALEKVRVTIRAKYGIELNDKHLLIILDSQARGLQEAMENKQTAKWDGVGKFIIKEGRERYLQTVWDARALGLKGDDLKAYMAEHKEIYIDEVRERIKLKKADGSIQS